MTLHQDIRNALEGELSNVSSLPADVDPENVHFDPTTGTEWVRIRLQPTQRRPTTIGPNPNKRAQGIFLVDVFRPQNEGPESAEQIADDVLQQFEPGKVLKQNNRRIHVQWSERAQARSDPPWYMVPVSVAWYLIET